MAAGHCDAVVAVGVVGGDAAELVAGGLGGLASWSAACSLVAARASGPSSSRGRGVAGQYRLPLAMIAPSWVPLGPRSWGCRSWTSCAPAGAQRERPGGGVAVGVAGVGEDVAERDPGGGHRGQHGGEGADRVVPARRDRGAAGELGDGRPVLLGHHDRRPTGSSRRTARPRCAAGCSCGGPRTPRGRRSRRLWRGGGREKDSRSVQSTASERAGVLELPPGRMPRAGHRRPPAACRRGQPVAARPCRGRRRPGRRCTRSAGRSAGAGRASSPRARRAAAGRLRAGWSAPGAPGSGGRAGRRPGPGTCRPAGCGPSAAGRAPRWAAWPRSAARRRRRR